MKSVLFAISFLFIGNVYGQNIDAEYNELVNSSETFKDYKVIKINELNTFWKNVMEIVGQKEELNTRLTNESIELKSQITSQKSEIESLSLALNELKTQTGSIKVFGIVTDKVVFKVIVFAFAATLLIIIGILMFQLKEKLILAKSKLKDFESLEIKFEEFRKTSLEKQMKLRRDLQTERNKLEEIQSI